MIRTGHATSGLGVSNQHFVPYVRAYLLQGRRQRSQPIIEINWLVHTQAKVGESKMTPLPVTCSGHVDTVYIVALICTYYGILALWACRPTPR